MKIGTQRFFQTLPLWSEVKEPEKTALYFV